MEQLLENYGEGAILVALGFLVGAVFGAAAQHSKFCLRAATVEVSEGHFGGRLTIWLIAFSAAVLAVQAGIAAGVLDVSQSRQLASTGSLSGAILGGLMFGAGMILARGCASRLLVLSATGNLRAFVTGLFLTLVAQASLTGILAPAREALGGLWLVEGGEARNLLGLLGMGSGAVVALSTIAMVASIWFALRNRVQISHIVAASLVGFAVAAGWFGTYFIAHSSFEIVAITSVTFTGPSTDTLLSLISERSAPLGFGIGLVPGVFVGASIAAVATGDWHIERFGPETPMERFLIGAFLMGFGSMLAGGCAVGAGMSGGAIFAITAWVALFCMWFGAMGMHLLTRQVFSAQQA